MNVIKGISIAIAVYLIGTFFIVYLMYKVRFGKRVETSDITADMADVKVKAVTFYSKNHVLSGCFYSKKEGECKTNEIILFVSGHGVSHVQYLLEINELVQRGHVVFAYDMTGCGSSEGKSIQGFAQFIIDADAALTYINALALECEIILFGHSLGAFAVAALLNKTKENIKKVIVMSGFNFPPNFVYMSMRKVLNFFAYPMQIWLFLLERIKFGSFATYQALKGINQFSGPVLIIQGKKDQVVPYAHSLSAIYSKVTNKRTTLILDENMKHYPTRIKKEDEQSINKDILDQIDIFIKQ